MTKKDYQKFAKMINELQSESVQSTAFDGHIYVQVDELVDKMVRIFMADNKNFSPSSFRNATKPVEI